MKALDLLEQLLAITSHYTQLLSPEDYERWQHISEECAGLRDGEWYNREAVMQGVFGHRL